MNHYVILYGAIGAPATILDIVCPDNLIAMFEARQTKRLVVKEHGDGKVVMILEWDLIRGIIDKAWNIGNVNVLYPPPPPQQPQQGGNLLVPKIGFN